MAAKPPRRARNPPAAGVAAPPVNEEKAGAEPAADPVALATDEPPAEPAEAEPEEPEEPEPPVAEAGDEPDPPALAETHEQTPATDERTALTPWEPVQTEATLPAMAAWTEAELEHWHSKS